MDTEVKEFLECLSKDDFTQERLWDDLKKILERLKLEASLNQAEEAIKKLYQTETKERVVI